MYLHVLGGNTSAPLILGGKHTLFIWFKINTRFIEAVSGHMYRIAAYVYGRLYCSFIMHLCATSTTSHTTSSLLLSLSPVHLLVYEQSSAGSLKITSEREATGAYAIGLLHVCGDVAFEKRWARGLKKDEVEGGGGGSQATKITPAYRAPTKCLAPACCLVWGGRCDLSESEGAGWMTSHHPFSSSNFPFIL